jgi:glycogen operon protein
LYNAEGETMTIDQWNDPSQRTLQFLAASTPEFEGFNRILLVVHASETDAEVLLPAHPGVDDYELLWDSAREEPDGDLGTRHRPGDLLGMSPQSMRLFRAHGEPAPVLVDAAADDTANGIPDTVHEGQRSG